MGISSGPPKHGAPTHNNSTRFKHNPSSRLTKIITSFPISGLCKKCTQVIQWRKDYRKYKPLTTVKRCTCCQQKSIKAAYHVICRPCAQTKHVCEKCLQPFTDDEKSTENIPFQELLETETSVSSECVELSEALSESSEAEAQSDESVSASES